MVNLGLAQVLLVFLPLVQCAVNIDDFFNVKAGNEDVGGCDQTYGSKTGKQWLQTWLNEAQTMTNGAVTAVNAYGTSKIARDNLLMFQGKSSRGREYWLSVVTAFRYQAQHCGQRC